MNLGARHKSPTGYGGFAGIRGSGFEDGDHWIDSWKFDFDCFVVVAATPARMIVGSPWRSPILSANAWLRRIGKTGAELREEGHGQVPACSTAILTALTVAHVMALVIKATGATTLVHGIVVARWLWFGILATSSLLAVVFDGRPIPLRAANVGNDVVSFALVDLIIGVWL